MEEEDVSVKSRDKAIACAQAAEAKAAELEDPFKAAVYWKGAAVAWEQAGGFMSSFHASKCRRAARQERDR